MGSSVECGLYLDLGQEDGFFSGVWIIFRFMTGGWVLQWSVDSAWVLQTCFYKHKFHGFTKCFRCIYYICWHKRLFFLKIIFPPICLESLIEANLIFFFIAESFLIFMNFWTKSVFTFYCVLFMYPVQCTM